MSGGIARSKPPSPKGVWQESLANKVLYRKLSFAINDAVITGLSLHRTLHFRSILTGLKTTLLTIGVFIAPL